MTTTLWLRVSSVITALFAAGHTLGGLKYWSPMGENAVLQAMRSVRFDVMGANRSYLDFYLGFGYSLSVIQAMLAILLWQFATMARTNAASVRPMIAVIILAVAACAVIAGRKLRQECRSGLKSASLEIREASRARAPDSPVPGEGRTPEQPGQTENSRSRLLKPQRHAIGLADRLHLDVFALRAD
jgi:hypothetical protein